MVKFPDKRSRYAGRAPWEFAAGTPRGDNPVQVPEAKTIHASRGTAPREAFRVYTTEDPALLQAQAEADEIKKRQEEYKARQNAISQDSSSDGASSELSSANVISAQVPMGVPSSDGVLAQPYLSRRISASPVGPNSSNATPVGTGSGATVGSSAASILATDD